MKKTSVLKANLWANEKDPQLSLESLRGVLEQNSYQDLQYKPEALESLMERVSRGETGSFDIAERKEYTNIELVFDEASNKLTAEFKLCHEDPRLNHNSLQQMVRENQFESLSFYQDALKTAIAQAAKNQRDPLELAIRQVYSDVSFGLDEVSNQLNAIVSSTFTDPKITLQSMQLSIRELGFEDLQFKKGALEALLTQIAKGVVADFVIAEKLDASISIDISADKMKASISTEAAFGGKAVNEESIEQAVRDANIDTALCDQEILNDVIGQESVSKICFAKGVSPKNGVDSKFKPLIEEVIEKSREADSDEKIDFLDVNDFIIVESGAELMRRIPATLGEDGKDVFGEPVKANPGNEIPFGSDINGAIVHPDDENLLIAESKGHPIISPASVIVDPVLRLANVDIKSGNISFDGSVSVLGEVMPGFTVDVTGDVTVKGMVENATIIAGHSIVVSGGVIGSEPNAEELAQLEIDKVKLKASGRRKEKEEDKENGKEKAEQPITDVSDLLWSRLQAGHSIDLKFMSMTKAVAGEDIVVKEYAIHSHLKSGKRILIGQEGGKGRLIGGSCYAVEGVISNEYGTDANVKTVVAAGNAANLSQEQKALKESLDESTNQVLKLSKVVTKMKEEFGNNRPAQVQAKINMIVNTVNALRSKIDEQADEVEKINQQIEESMKITIACKKQIYPNVEFCINGVTQVFSLDAQSGVYRIEGKNIVLSDEKSDG